MFAWYEQAMAELDSTVADAGLTPTGPIGGLYDNELIRQPCAVIGSGCRIGSEAAPSGGPTGYRVTAGARRTRPGW